MGRIRTVKPKLFTHEGLYDAEHETDLPLRTAFIGLFTEADREGRFQWRPRTLKAAILPFDELDFSTVLDALEEHHFIMRYSASNGEVLGVIPTFKQHQQINIREAASELEAPDEKLLKQWFAHAHYAMHMQNQAMHVHARGEGKGKEGKGRERNSSLRSQQPRVRAREGPKAAQSSTALAAAAANEQASDVIDAGEARKPAELAAWLRAHGVSDAQATHALVRQWAVDEAVSDAVLSEALARLAKRHDVLHPMSYLATIMPDVLAAFAAVDSCAHNVKAMPVRTNGQNPDFDSLAKDRKRVSDGLTKPDRKIMGSDVIDMGTVQEVRDESKHS